MTELERDGMRGRARAFLICLEARIVCRDALSRQHSPLDQGVRNVAGYEYRQLCQFVPTSGGGLKSVDRLPLRKRSVVSQLLARINRRHYQIPDDEDERGGET